MHEDVDIQAFARARKRRLAFAVGTAAALFTAAIAAWVYLTPRRVTIVGPTAGKITVAEEKPARFPARVGMVVELSPGTYAIDSEDPANHDAFTVPAFARHVVQPARRDHCLIVASALDAYAFEGETRTDEPFTVLEYCTDRYATSLVRSELYIDPCMLPHSIDLFADAYLAVAVPRDEAPSDDAEANAKLAALLLACG